MWIGLDDYIEFFVRMTIKYARRIGTSDWPAYTATVVSSNLDSGFTTCLVVTIHYKYRDQDKRYEGTYKQPFINRNYAEAYLRRYPGGSEFPIIVSPKHPTYSLPVEGAIEFIKMTPETEESPSSGKSPATTTAAASNREPASALAQPLRPPPISAPSSGRRVPLASRIDAAVHRAPRERRGNSAHPSATNRREDWQSHTD
jgi:hypothetical protein